MCLESITKKPRKHEVGFKICRKEGDQFKGQVYDTGPYILGETYDAKEDGKPIPFMSTFGGKYQVGFHYYLKLKDAKSLCNNEEAVIRILVKNILATGKQNKRDAGVSEFMTLHKVVFDAVEDRYNLFLKVCKGKVQQEIIKFAKKFHDVIPIPANECERMANFMTGSDETFIEWVSFVDCFPRKGICFKMMTRVHIWAMNHHFGYKDIYHKVVKQSEEFDEMFLKKDYTRKFYSMNVDDIILQQL